MIERFLRLFFVCLDFAYLVDIYDLTIGDGYERCGFGLI